MSRAIRRIICVGNRFVSGDDTGPRVFDFLSKFRLPDGVEVIDGGLAGLNLLSLVESSEKVVFVDSLSGFCEHGKVAELERDALLNGIHAINYGHSGGINYLFRALPFVCEGKLPDIFVVGSEGIADNKTIKSIAEKSLEIIAVGVRDDHDYEVMTQRGTCKNE